MARADYRTWVGYTDYKPGYKIWICCEELAIETFDEHRVFDRLSIPLLPAENFNEDDFFDWLVRWLIVPFGESEEDAWEHLRFKGKRVNRPTNG